jgi:hypothetical protein
MRNWLVILFFLLYTSLFAQVNVTPKCDGSVPDAVTAFGVNIASGQKIYNRATGQLFVCNTPTLSTATLTSASSNFRDIGDYNQLENKPTIADTSMSPTKRNAARNASWVRAITDNFGIGTISPAAKLDVQAGTTTVNSIVNAAGSINDYLQCNIQNTSTGTGAQSGYSATADNGTGTTNFAWVGINNSTFNNPQQWNIGGADDVSFMGFGSNMYISNMSTTLPIYFTTGKSTSPYYNTRMTILNNGNVGVNTTTPTDKLDVNGYARVRGRLIIGDTTGVYSYLDPGIGIPTYASTSSDVTTTGQTLVNITGLSVALVAGASYEFEAVLGVSTSAVTTGCEYGVNAPTASTITAVVSGSYTTTASEMARITAANTPTGALLTTSSQSGGVVIKGLIVTKGNSGNLTIEHLKVTSGTSTVFSGSLLKVTRIN